MTATNPLQGGIGIINKPGIMTLFPGENINTP